MWQKKLKRAVAVALVAAMVLTGSSYPEEVKAEGISYGETRTGGEIHDYGKAGDDPKTADVDESNVEVNKPVNDSDRWKARAYAPDQESVKYGLTANGAKVSVYKYQKADTPGTYYNMDIARFSSDDATPEFVITLEDETVINSVEIYPERYYPNESLEISGDKKTLKFSMSDKIRYCIVNINGSTNNAEGRPQLAIVNDPTEVKPDLSGKNVLDFKEFSEKYLKEHPINDTVGGKCTEAGSVTDKTLNTDVEFTWNYKEGKYQAYTDAEVKFPNKRVRHNNDVTDAFQAALQEVKKSSEYDTIYFPAGTYIWSGLEIRDWDGDGADGKLTIYTDEDALMVNRMQECQEAMEPAIGIWDSSNITISGRGIYDGQGCYNYSYNRADADKTPHQGGCMVVRSKNITFNDTYVRDVKQWNYECHTVENITYNNIKGLSPYEHSWMDGLDLTSGKNVTVNGSFTMGNDDTFASGHYNPSDEFPRRTTELQNALKGKEAGTNTSTLGLSEEMINRAAAAAVYNKDRLEWDTADSEGYHLNNGLGWTRCANSIRLGHNTKWKNGGAESYQLKDYHFKNFNSVLFNAGAAIRIQDGVSSCHPNYEKLVFEDCSFAGNLDSNVAAPKANLNNVTKENFYPNEVTVKNCWFKDPAQEFAFKNIKNLTLQDIYLGGKLVKYTSQMENLVMMDDTIDSKTFTANGENVIENHMPKFTAPEQALTAYSGSEFTFKLEATDADGDEVKFGSADVSGLEGAEFDAATGVFRWVPTEAQAGKKYEVTFAAYDKSKEYTGQQTEYTVAIDVISSLASQKSYMVSEDARVQGWSSERDSNFGDGIWLTVNKHAGAEGELGEKIKTDSKFDGKLVFLKFDLSQMKEQEFDKAELSLTYISGRYAANVGKNDKIRVAVIDDISWKESELTWNNKPNFTISAGQYKESDEYNLGDTSQDKPGEKGEYNFKGKKVIVDITDILKAALESNKDKLSLVVNDTEGLEHYFVSKEGVVSGSNYPSATPDMAPSIILEEGYQEVKSAGFVIKGCAEPVVTLVGNTADGKISWDGESRKLKIAEGITEGEYTVKIQVKESETAEQSAECEFKLKVTKKQEKPVGISGPQDLTLKEGYEATETGSYTITGGTSPVVTLAGNTAGGKISWDEASKKLKIAAGIPEGNYTVKIQVKENGSAEPSTECEFTLKVTKDQGGNPPTSIAISGPQNLALVEGYEATETGSYTITGGTSPAVTLAGNTAGGKISWDGESKKLKIAGGIPEGDYTVKIQVKEDGSAETSAECEFKLTVTKKGLEIEDGGNGNYQVKIPETAPGQDKPISILLPGALAESIKNSQAEQITINVKIPGNVASDKIEAIAIPKEVLEAAREAGKDLTITVDGSISYQWAFRAENLASAQIDDLNLALEVDSEKDAEIKNLLNKDEQGMVISFAQQGEIHGAKVTIDASKMGWKAGETVTLGCYNPERKELETVGAYSVGEDGKVAIDPAKGGKYVLWKKTGSGTAARVDRVELNKTKLTLNVKEAYTLKATIKPDGAAGAGLAWKSEDERIAYVDQKGVVTGKKAGKTKIIATAGDKTATCTVTVKVPVSKVMLNKTKLTMGVKETFSLKATVKPGNATNKTVEWKSSNKKTVEVKKGKLSAKKKGTATITATVDGRKVTCKVTVKPAPTKKAKVTLNAKSVKLKLKGKKTFQIKPKVSSKFGSAAFQYTVDKKGRKVVKVDKNGKVTARKKGKATITVKTYNKKGNAKLKVTVK